MHKNKIQIQNRIMVFLLQWFQEVCKMSIISHTLPHHSSSSSRQLPVLLLWTGSCTTAHAATGHPSHISQLPTANKYHSNKVKELKLISRSLGGSKVHVLFWKEKVRKSIVTCSSTYVFSVFFLQNVCKSAYEKVVVGGGGSRSTLGPSSK